MLLEFASRRKKSKKKDKRSCKAGYPCGASCISRNYFCKRPLSKQGKSYADWLHKNGKKQWSDKPGETNFLKKKRLEGKRGDRLFSKRKGVKGFGDFYANLRKVDISGLQEEKEVRDGLSPEVYRSAMRGQGRKGGGRRGGSYGIPYTGTKTKTVYSSKITQNLNSEDLSEYIAFENKEIYAKAFKANLGDHDNLARIVYASEDYLTGNLSDSDANDYIKLIKENISSKRNRNFSETNLNNWIRRIRS